MVRPLHLQALQERKSFDFNLGWKVKGESAGFYQELGVWSLGAAELGPFFMLQKLGSAIKTFCGMCIMSIVWLWTSSLLLVLSIAWELGNKELELTEATQNQSDTRQHPAPPPKYQSMSSLCKCLHMVFTFNFKVGACERC